LRRFFFFPLVSRSPSSGGRALVVVFSLTFSTFSRPLQETPRKTPIRLTGALPPAKRAFFFFFLRFFFFFFSTEEGFCPGMPHEVFQSQILRVLLFSPLHSVRFSLVLGCLLGPPPLHLVLFFRNCWLSPEDVSSGIFFFPSTQVMVPQHV